MRNHDKYKYVFTEELESVLIIKINKQETLNSLNLHLLNELDDLFDSIEYNLYSCIIITGEGKAYIAGADISEMVNMNELEAKAFSLKGNNLFKKIENFQIPVIAAINGYAIGGGCELAMACDIRLASIKAKFGQPECGLGIIPGFLGTKRLSNIVGLSKAKELIFTGKLINAQEAYQIGLVNAVYEENELIEKSILMAKEISKNNNQAIRIAKKTINENYYLNIDESIINEINSFSNCFKAENHKNLMIKFLNKK